MVVVVVVVVIVVVVVVVEEEEFINGGDGHRTGECLLLLLLLLLLLPYLSLDAIIDPLIQGRDRVQHSRLNLCQGLGEEGKVIDCRHLSTSLD